MITIKFIRVWGHPTRNEIYGPGQIVKVSEWVAEVLCRGGYAIRL